MDLIERRSLLLAGVGTALLAMSDGTKAQSTIALSQAPTIGVSPNAIDVLSKSRGPKSWKKLKDQIGESSNALAGFDPSFEEGVVTKLEEVAIAETRKLTHNPRLVEPLLGEIASLLDRCFTYRREASELEIAGVAAGASVIALEAIYDFDRKLAQFDPAAAAAGILAANYTQAGSQFQRAGGLGLGFAAQLKIEASANSEILLLNNSRRKLLLEKLSFVHELQRSLAARHSVSGNADNYLERFEQLRKLYELDILAAFKRAQAVVLGLKDVFGLTLSAPKVTSTGFLDEMIIWTRNAMRAVALLGEREIEYNREVHFAVAGDGAGSFTVGKEFQGLKSVRMRAVAGYYTIYGSGGDYTNNSINNSVASMVMVKSDDKTEYKPVIILPSIRSWNAQRPLDFADGALFYNLNPMGEWSFRVKANLLNGAGGATPRGTQVNSIILIMRVTAIPENVDGTWWVGSERL